MEFSDEEYIFADTHHFYENKIWIEKETQISLNLEAAIEFIAYEVQGRHHSGYENNEGGGGEITFDVESKVIQHVHYHNVVQRVEDSTEINLAEELAES